MKREVMRFDAPRPKRRAKELFDREFNFSPKTVERKDQYRRKPKYKNRFIDDEYGDGDYNG